MITVNKHTRKYFPLKGRKTEQNLFQIFDFNPIKQPTQEFTDQLNQIMRSDWTPAETLLPLRPDLHPTLLVLFIHEGFYRFKRSRKVLLLCSNFRLSVHSSAANVHTAPTILTSSHTQTQRNFFHVLTAGSRPAVPTQTINMVQLLLFRLQKGKLLTFDAKRKLKTGNMKI